jgi:hypothetical protein
MVSEKKTKIILLLPAHLPADASLARLRRHIRSPKGEEAMEVCMEKRARISPGPAIATVPAVFTGLQCQNKERSSARTGRFPHPGTWEKSEPGRPVLRKAVLTVNRSPLGRLERDFALFAAI